jgi:hypothetical protein
MAVTIEARTLTREQIEQRRGQAENLLAVADQMRLSHSAREDAEFTIALCDLALSAQKDAARWRTVEHGMMHVSFTPIGKEPHSWDPRSVKYLVKMREFIDQTKEEHLAALRSAREGD